MTIITIIIIIISSGKVILRLFKDIHKSISWSAKKRQLTANSGAPARAKRAWDRAPYPWNMVNLFSFGCHVSDRAYLRVYRLYGWGRGDYQKEGRGVSGVSRQVHIFNIGH